MATSCFPPFLRFASKLPLEILALPVQSGEESAEPVDRIDGTGHGEEKERNEQGSVLAAATVRCCEARWSDRHLRILNVHLAQSDRRASLALSEGEGHFAEGFCVGVFTQAERGRTRQKRRRGRSERLDEGVSCWPLSLAPSGATQRRRTGTAQFPHPTQC